MKMKTSTDLCRSPMNSMENYIALKILKEDLLLIFLGNKK